MVGGSPTGILRGSKKKLVGQSLFSFKKISGNVWNSLIFDFWHTFFGQTQINLEQWSMVGGSPTGILTGSEEKLVERSLVLQKYFKKMCKIR